MLMKRRRYLVSGSSVTVGTLRAKRSHLDYMVGRTVVVQETDPFVAAWLWCECEPAPFRLRFHRTELVSER